MWMHGFGGGFGFGWIFFLLFWGLIAWAVFALIRSLSGSNHGGGCCGSHNHGQHDIQAEGGPAMEILKERYAKGELKQEEFERMKKDLQ